MKIKILSMFTWNTHANFNYFVHVQTRIDWIKYDVGILKHSKSWCFLLKTFWFRYLWLIGDAWGNLKIFLNNFKFMFSRGNMCRGIFESGFGF